MQMSPALVLEARTALRRARARERYEAMTDALYTGGVEWGTAIEGHVPPSNSSYRTVDKPARAHLQSLYDQSTGQDAPPTPEARMARHTVLLTELFND